MFFKQTIFKAAKEGDIAAVSSFVKNGADVNGRDKYSFTALCHAVSKGHFGLATYLISVGANVNITTDIGITPLCLISTDNPMLAALLVVKGASVNPPPSKYGVTPLWHSTCSGFPMLSNYLVAHGANVEAKDTLTGTGPLVWAAWKGLTDTVIFLLAKGADPNSQSNKRHTALRYAVINRDALMIEALITFGADPRIDAIEIAELQKTYAIANHLRKSVGDEEKDYRKQKFLDMVEKIASIAAQAASQL